MRPLPPEISLVRAPNPGPFTGPGTNSWVFGDQEVVVIDPGPLDEGHLDRLLVSARSRGRIAAVLCTHHHIDHLEGAIRFCEMAQAPLARFHLRVENPGELPLEDGDRILAGRKSLVALHTPGHASDHLCFHADRERVLFTGDHVLSGTTSVIWPPDGNMAEYMRSLELVDRLAPAWILPGHGDPVDDPAAHLRGLITHRQARERQVLEALRTRAASPSELVPVLYRSYPEEIWPAAAQSLLAHCLKLASEGLLTGDGEDVETRFSAV